MFGPGRYAAQCNQVLIESHADAVLLVVFNGDKGSGFEVHGKQGVVVDVPAILREMANVIEQEDKKIKES